MCVQEPCSSRKRGTGTTNKNPCEMFLAFCVRSLVCVCDRIRAKEKLINAFYILNIWVDLCSQANLAVTLSFCLSISESEIEVCEMTELNMPFDVYDVCVNSDRSAGERYLYGNKLYKIISLAFMQLFICWQNCFYFPLMSRVFTN